jgi:hypothetical protein
MLPLGFIQSTLDASPTNSALLDCETSVKSKLIDERDTKDNLQILFDNYGDGLEKLVDAAWTKDATIPFFHMMNLWDGPLNPKQLIQKNIYCDGDADCA